MYQAILFDLDDTLYDLRSYWTSRLTRAFDQAILHHPHLNKAEMMRAALAEKVYMQQMPDFLRKYEIQDEALIAAISDAYRHNWFEELALAEDTVDTLRALQPRYKLGLVTNGPSRTQRAKIEHFGLAAYMDVLIVSEEVGVAKPDPGIFAIALERLAMEPSKVLFVGDSVENDLHGAAAASLPFVWVNRRHETLPEGVPPPVAVITRLAELPPLIEKLDV
jgi:putative hydrolase of the HAD superfamily